MAKRKRLEVPVEPFSGDLETKSAFPPATTPRARMPIAEVAGDTAGRAALEEVAQEMTAAEAQGRVIKKLPLDKIEIRHLARDRMVFDEAEMEVLKTSLAERGQQTPIEVVHTSGGYGLISGLRRVLALKDLGATEVLALIRQPETAEAAYIAMVEENEIRAGLSYYERANIAVAAVGQGVYPTPKRAVAGLFANVSSAKRSKISRFVVIRDALGKVLAFPTAIPEKLGLDLAAAIEADKGVAKRLAEALRKTPPEDALDERKAIERALKAPKAPGSPQGQEIAPGVVLKAGKGRVALSGPAVNQGFIDALQAWAVSHAKDLSSKG
ncbi:MAG: ParB N-terminal domain-containing protein [Pseudomonadota bacterium]